MSEPFEGWVILELFGHRQLAGFLREEEIAGAKFLRLDTPGDLTHPPVSQIYSTAAVYCITPTTEAIARGIAARTRPEPYFNMGRALPGRVEQDEVEQDEEAPL